MPKDKILELTRHDLLDDCWYQDICLCNTHICVYAYWNMHHYQHRSKKWARESNLITCTYLKEWTLFYCRWNHLVMVTENFPLVFYTILHPELPVNTLMSWNELGNIPSVGNIPAWIHKHLHNQTHPCLFPGHPSKDDSLIQLSVWAKHILIPHISQKLDALYGHWVLLYQPLWCIMGLLN